MNSLRRYSHKVRHFGVNAKLYLVYSFANGFSMGILRLLFNFYVLSLGYDAGTLGLLVALPPIIITFAAIPAGMLGQRIGYRATLMLGAALMGVSIFGISISTGVIALVGFSVLRGLSRTLAQVSSAPFMSENSGREERTHLFSVQAAARTVCSFLGFLLAGVLPTMIAWLLSVGAEDPTAYRGALWVSAAIFGLSVLPLLRMSRPPAKPADAARPRLREMLHPPGQLLRLFTPQAILGFGAGMLVPFLNVYLRTTFDLSDGYVGLLFALQSLMIAVATLIGPVLAERLSRIRAVLLVQLLSIPFFIVLGYVPVLWLASAAFLARASLMNAANPLYNAFAMDAVPEEKRPGASAVMQISWQGTRGLSALVSGQIQQTAGFSALFPITIGCYLAGSALIWTFFGKKKGPCD